VTESLENSRVEDGHPCKLQILENVCCLATVVVEACFSWNFVTNYPLMAKMMVGLSAQRFQGLKKKLFTGRRN